MIPPALAARPHWGRYPIPWVTYVPEQGPPDFRVHVEARRQAVADERRCQLCGTPMGDEVVFLGFTAAVATKRFGEPPGHRACIEYALDECPWLSGKPYSGRPGAEGTVWAPRPDLPTEIVMYTCMEFRAVPDPAGMTEIVYQAGPPTQPPRFIGIPSATY